MTVTLLVYIDGVLLCVGPTYYKVKRPTPFPEDRTLSSQSPPTRPVYSGTTSGPSNETLPTSYPPPTHSSQPSSLYPGLPADVNVTSYMPYSSQGQYPPPTTSQQNRAPVGESTPLLQ